MKVDPDRSFGLSNPVEDGLPELRAALGNTALAMDAEGQAVDGGAALQQIPDRIPAIRCVRLWREPLDRLVCVRTVRPRVGVGPKPELEVQPEGGGLLRGEAKRGQIALTLLIRDLRDPHRVAGNRDQEGVRKVQVGVGNPAREVVTEAQREADSVEPLSNKHGQVAAPEALVAIPREILNIAAEEPGDTPYGICRPFDEWPVLPDGCQRVVPKLDSVGQFEHGINEPPDVGRTCGQSLLRPTQSDDCERLRDCGQVSMCTPLSAAAGPRSRP